MTKKHIENIDNGFKKKNILKRMNIWRMGQEEEENDKKKHQKGNKK